MTKIKATPVVFALVLGFITYAILSVLEWLKTIDIMQIAFIIMLIACISAWSYYIYDLKRIKKPIDRTTIKFQQSDNDFYREVQKQILKSKTIKIHSLNELKKMNPYKFEDYVADIYRKLDYDVIQTPRSGDGGKDIIIKKDGQVYYVECKRYEKPIESKRMRDFIGACAIGGDSIKGIYVTTSSYTKDSIAAAKAKGIELIDGYQLVDLAQKATNSNKI